MNLQVSCPVFRCPKTSVSKCTGYRRACERYYCQTHTEGTLCDRCTRIKQENAKENYKQMLNDLSRKSLSASLKGGVAALFIISILLLAVAIVCAFLPKYNQSLLLVVSLVGGGVGFIGALIWYYAKAREYMRAESTELDMKYPGFYDYYQQWQKKLDDIGTDTN